MASTARSRDRSFAVRVPGVRALAGLFDRVARIRWRGIPIGLIALLPVSLFIDLFDVADELVGGPVGMGLSFILESAFILGLTGRTSYALGFAGFDLIPVLDVIPFATLTLLREISVAWRQPADAPKNAGDEWPPTGPIIDV